MSLTPGRQIAHYRLLSPIGEGGMGVVWKADDLRLGRAVALKFLPAEAVEDAERRALFLNEARLASSLNDRGVVQVHALEQTEGLEFIAMEFIDGEPLDRRIARGALAVRDAVSLGKQAAQTIAAAHRNGLIHRDIKPANMMIARDGDLKLLDFGLAVLFETKPSEPDERTRTSRKTSSGGTLAYMSPARLRGKASSADDDVYALGVVLYEALSGRHPFAAPTSNELIAQTLAGEFTPLAEAAPEAPATLAGIVERCLTSARTGRMPTADELATELARLERALERGDDLATASAAEVWRHRWASGGTGMVGVAVVLVTAVLFWKFSPLGSPKLDPKRIAVMPFQTQGQPGGSEYLGTMIADAIAANLVTSPDLAVLPASELGAGRRGRATMRDYLSAGQRLGAGRCIVGRVARTGDSLQLSVSLLDGARGTLLWGQVISSHERNLASTTAAIAQLAAEKLTTVKPKKLYDSIGNLSGGPEMATSLLTTQVLSAYSAFDVPRLDSLTRELCAQFPAELDAHVLRAAALQAANHDIPSPERRQAYLTAVDTIAIMEPAQPYALILNGIQTRYDSRYDAALAIFDTVLTRSDLTPSARGHVLRQKGTALSLSGQLAPALSTILEARHLDPLNPANYEHLSATSARQGDLKACLRYAQQGLLLSPRNSRLNASLAAALDRMGRWKEAVRPESLAFEVSRGQTHGAGLAILLERAGQSRAAQTAAAQAEALPPSRYGQINMARYWCITGDRTKALKCLHVALDLGYADIDFWNESELESLRRDPEFKQIEAEVRRRLALQ